MPNADGCSLEVAWGINQVLDCKQLKCSQGAGSATAHVWHCCCPSTPLVCSMLRNACGTYRTMSNMLNEYWLAAGCCHDFIVQHTHTAPQGPTQHRTTHLMLGELVRPRQLPLQELCAHDQAVPIDAAGGEVWP